MNNLEALKNKTILVTGSAGFIGFHVSKVLLENGINIIGLDNFNDYYDIALKETRNEILEKFPNFKLYRGDMADLNFVKTVFKENKIDKVCNLGAQAGVRYSLENPHAYIQSNIVGFTNIIETAKDAGIKDFIYASSSSVYGNGSEGEALSEEKNTEEPISLYAATKKANELLAYTYHHNFDMNCTGLRFFTVYGPYGRPDMAYFSFTTDILAGKTVKFFNNGKNRRDFTYIDDIVDGVISALSHSYPYEIFNLGNSNTVEFLNFVQTLESSIGEKIENKELLPAQAGDVTITYADITKAKEKLGFDPKISIEEGIGKFINWYKEYYKI